MTGQEHIVAITLTNVLFVVLTMLLGNSKIICKRDFTIQAYDAFGKHPHWLGASLRYQEWLRGTGLSHLVYPICRAWTAHNVQFFLLKPNTGIIVSGIGEVVHQMLQNVFRTITIPVSAFNCCRSTTVTYKRNTSLTIFIAQPQGSLAVPVYRKK